MRELGRDAPFFPVRRYINLRVSETHRLINKAQNSIVAAAGEIGVRCVAIPHRHIFAPIMSDYTVRTAFGGTQQEDITVSGLRRSIALALPPSFADGTTVTTVAPYFRRISGPGSLGVILTSSILDAEQAAAYHALHQKTGVEQDPPTALRMELVRCKPHQQIETVEPILVAAAGESIGKTLAVLPVTFLPYPTP